MKTTLVMLFLFLASCRDTEHPDIADAGDASVVDTGSPMDGSVEKQNGGTTYPTATPVDADYARLPLSLMVQPKFVHGFDSALPAIWVINDWPGTDVSYLGRDRSGSWYRAHAYSPTMSYTRRIVFSEPYSCSPGFWGADCVADSGARTSVACPYEMVMNEVPSQWRSQSLPWPQNNVGWFWMDIRAYQTWFTTANTLKLQFAGVAVSGARGQQVNCNYHTLKPGGWPYFDVWLQHR